ncbi:MAG: NHL repeat-containing protein [Gammaproteobacteria bacterium]|nr:NHL repeat-containing protein [Gammaproteobacteria bacterium]
MASAAPEFVRATAGIFANPHDLELDPSGRWVFVADVNHHNIKVIDAKTLEAVAVVGVGKLNAPHDVHFDSAGRLLVADSGNDRIAIYDIDGAEARFIGELEDGMRSPEGVTSDPDGNIYVASTGNHKILKFHNGNLIKTAGGRGSGKLEFVRPHDIERGRDGLLYVGDPGNSRIQVLTDALDYHASIEDRKQPFDEPKYLALDGDWLFVADQRNNRLRIFNAQRNEVANITNAGDKPLNNIEGVEAYNGLIWIADTYNDRVVLFRWPLPE